MSDKIYLGRNMAQLELSPALEPISKVVLLVDDENAYVAGDDTGRTMELTCPYGTQEMANHILTSLKAYTYTPLQAQDALLDPAAELGDGLTAGGVYTVLGQMELTWDALMTSDCGAPGKAEQESEYQYRSPVLSEIDHQIAETRSTITKTAEEIRLEVANEIKGLSASISVQLDSITSTVQGQGQAISTIQQKVDSIRLSVSNGTSSSSITLTVDGVAVSSQNITFTGVVTFAALAGNGTTVINGNNITTGTIDAERLNLTGAITFSDLSRQVAEDLSDAYSMASDAQGVVSGWTYGGTTYIDGSRIMAGTVSASTLEGGSVQLLNYSGAAVGVMTMTGSSSTSFAIDLTSYGALRLSGRSGDTFIESGDGTYLHLSDEVYIGYGNLAPNQSGMYSCGTSKQRWSDIYADSSAATTSDRNQKNTVTYDMNPYDALFDRLKPTPFRYNNGTSGRTHLGMISQDVEQALADAGLSTQDFAGFIRGEDKNGAAVCMLRYEEFIALCIHQIQQLKGRVKELEELL